MTASAIAVAALIPLLASATDSAQVPAGAAGEYSRHFDALKRLSIAVAQTMPPDHYGFRPHSESMSFAELMSHIAITNYQFCAGLKDTSPPLSPSPSGKEATVKFLSDSFDYCSKVIPTLTAEDLIKPHDSPDGRLPGRDIMLALYIHVAHHRGQAEIYLRDNGIKPPAYMI